MFSSIKKNLCFEYHAFLFPTINNYFSLIFIKNIHDIIAFHRVQIHWNFCDPFFCFKAVVIKIALTLFFFRCTFLNFVKIYSSKRVTVLWRLSVLELFGYVSTIKKMLRKKKPFCNSVHNILDNLVKFFPQKGEVIYETLGQCMQN